MEQPKTWNGIKEANKRRKNTEQLFTTSSTPAFSTSRQKVDVPASSSSSSSSFTLFNAPPNHNI